MLVEVGRARQMLKIILGAPVIQREGTGQLLMGTPLVVAVEAPHLVEGEERHLVLVVAPRKTPLATALVVVVVGVPYRGVTALPVSS